MRIDLIEAFGQAPAIIPVRMPEYGDGFPRPVITVLDHPLIGGVSLSHARVSALGLFLSSNTFPSSPAIKNDKPVIPMQSRRRRKTLLLRGRRRDKRLHLAADPVVPERNSRHGLWAARIIKRASTTRHGTLCKEMTGVYGFLLRG